MLLSVIKPRWFRLSSSPMYLERLPALERSIPTTPRLVNIWVRVMKFPVRA